MIAFEQQVENFCILTRKLNQPYPKIRWLLPDEAQNQKDLLDRQNEFLEVPFRLRILSYLLTLAVPPFITRSTSAKEAAVVSPAVVIANAPCAAP